MGKPVGVCEVHRSRRSTLPVQRNFLPEDGWSKCSFQSTVRGPRACSISLLTQALTLGLAWASTSALGRRNRIVNVFDVTQDVYHSFPKLAMLHPGGSTKSLALVTSTIEHDYR